MHLPREIKEKSVSNFAVKISKNVVNNIEESKNEECKSASFILTVSDNGVGIPENLDFENLDSLGFQLIFSLVEQLDGEIELKRNNGTEFIITFTVAEYNYPISVPASQQLV